MVNPNKIQENKIMIIVDFLAIASITFVENKNKNVTRETDMKKILIILLQIIPNAILK